MVAGRRNVAVENDADWVFNRIADVYSARPPYPPALVDCIAALAPPGGRVLELGAGIGHLAIPLAERGLRVAAVEPAEAMLARLRAGAAARGVALATHHATAEALPLDAESHDLVVIADALHFLNLELAAPEVARVLDAHGALAIVTCEFADTAFMRDVTRIMQQAAPRRPRDTANAIAQLASIVGVALSPRRPPRVFEDRTPVQPAQLEAILRSISFIGPAMNPIRFADFRRQIHALDDAPVWARRFELHRFVSEAGAGRRRPGIVGA
jgi:ubiquinone/menaquinone biosynthesis C-methylase UbiE